MTLSGKTSKNYPPNRTAFTCQFVISNTDDAHVDVITNFLQRKLALTLTAINQICNDITTNFFLHKINFFFTDSRNSPVSQL